ncbi:hypothetical protein GCM10020254_87420 [Streptomyces goshikiensis]
MRNDVVDRDSGLLGRWLEHRRDAEHGLFRQMSVRPAFLLRRHRDQDRIAHSLDAVVQTVLLQVVAGVEDGYCIRGVEAQLRLQGCADALNTVKERQIGFLYHFRI